MEKEYALSLQRRITIEAVALISLGGDAADTGRHEQTVTLIGEAWDIPKETTQERLTLIQREREAVRALEAGQEAGHVLKDEDILQTATGLEILALTKGLFETSLRLSTYQNRAVLYDMAEELEECLNLSEWIVRAKGEEDEPT